MAILRRNKLHNGAAELKQPYARLVMREVSIKDKEIRITSSKAVLAKGASRGRGKTAPAVLSFVRKWRTRQDSNL